jgi:hypothetical protein
VVKHNFHAVPIYFDVQFSWSSYLTKELIAMAEDELGSHLVIEGVGGDEVPQKIQVPEEQLTPQEPSILQEHLPFQPGPVSQEQAQPEKILVLQQQKPQAIPVEYSPPPSYEALLSQRAPPENRKEKPSRKFGAFRITELPKNTTKKSLLEALQLFLAQNGENAGEDAICRLSVAPYQNDPDSFCIATVTFAVEPKALKKCSSGSDETLQLKIDGTSCSVGIDGQFTGMTTLHCYEPMVE